MVGVHEQRIRSTNNSTEWILVTLVFPWGGERRDSRAQDRKAPVGDLGAGHRLERLDRGNEYVAESALGLDHLRSGRIRLQLPSESQNLDIDAAIIDVLVDPG